MVTENERSPEALDAGLRLLDSVDAPALYADAAGVVVRANASWVALFGESDAGEWGWLEPMLPGSRIRAKRSLIAAMSSGSRIEIEVDVRGADGEVLQFALVGGVHRASEGNERGMLVLAWDVTERRRNEERLAFIAGHDSLTGLPNRRTFIEALNRAVNRASRGTPSVLLMLDVDHLKAYNDVFGHLAGDQALINVGMHIRRHVRASDVPARIGGDEFAVILEGASIEEASVIADRMREAVSSGGIIPGVVEQALGLSGGLVVIEAGADATTVMNRADLALYAAKTTGRDRMIAWDTSLIDGGTPARLEAAIREAFSTDGFSLVFQPVVRLSDGSVSYYESLVRMHSADGTVYGPAEFLPLVENMGRMPGLTRRIVEMALWNLASVSDCAVSVNLSASDLGDHELLEHVERAIVAAGPLGGRLIFEVSESALLSGLVRARAWMRRLVDLGCRFVLDDFGSGAGVFALLREERIEQVKLSRTVVNALSDEGGTRAFVVALREMIELHGKQAVATFLENEQMLGEVRHAGFTLGQGNQLHEPTADLAGLVAEFSSHE